MMQDLRHFDNRLAEMQAREEREIPDARERENNDTNLKERVEQ
jgi:hypothetical protein